MAEPRIIHSKSKQRFEMQTEAGEAYINYHIGHGSAFDIDYTFVPRTLRGLGLGEALVKAGADYAASQGYLLSASCSYADRIIRTSEWSQAREAKPEITS